LFFPRFAYLFIRILTNMHLSTAFLGMVGVATTVYAQTQYTSTNVAAVAAAAATAKTLSPVSEIRGKQFDRFVNIWLENTDFDMAAGDRMSSLPSKPLPKPS